MSVQTHRPAVALRQMAPGDGPQLQAAAAADGHGLILPTHVVLRCPVRQPTETVGYASVGAAKLFFAWLRSDLPARDSFNAWAQAETLLQRQHAGPVTLAITPQSPLRPFVERKGYRRLGTYELYVKDF